jgi:hypothetical protein
MLSYFPILFPDESIFSAITRYHTLLGQPKARYFFQGLFGKYPVVHSFKDLSKITGQKPIEILAARILGGDQNLSRILEGHTHLPITTCFEKWWRSPNIHHQSFKNWKYCEMCSREDSINYGVNYWHRSHQVFGVKCCYRHLTMLSTASCRDVGPGVFYKESASGSPSVKGTVAQIRYSRWIHELLNGVRFSFAPRKLPLIVDYRLWKSQVIRSQDAEVRFRDRYCSLFHDGTYEWPYHPLVYLSALAHLFEDIREVESFAGCGILEPTEMSPVLFRRCAPNINWKWIYRHNSFLSDGEERYWLRKYDSRWMAESEFLRKKSDQRALELHRFRTTYVFRC